ARWRRSGSRRRRTPRRGRHSGPRPRRGRQGCARRPSANRGAPDRLPARSFRALEEESRAQLGAVEPAVAARRRERRLEAAVADCSVERLLADAEEPRGLAGADQPGALGLVLEACRVDLYVSLAEAPVTSGRDQGGTEKTARHGARHSRRDHAEAGRHIPRTDQSLQGVVLRVTNPYQKAVAISPRYRRWSLGFQEWGRHFVVENMQR